MVLLKDEWNLKAARKLHQDEKEAQVTLTGNERHCYSFSDMKEVRAGQLPPHRAFRLPCAPGAPATWGRGCPCPSHPKTPKGARDAGSDFEPAHLKVLTNVGKFLEDKN